jgi:hypothetical protein
MPVNSLTGFIPGIIGELPVSESILKYSHRQVPISELAFQQELKAEMTRQKWNSGQNRMSITERILGLILAAVLRLIMFRLESIMVLV